MTATLPCNYGPKHILGAGIDRAYLLKLDPKISAQRDGEEAPSRLSHHPARQHHAFGLTAGSDFSVQMGTGDQKLRAKGQAQIGAVPWSDLD